MSRICMYMLRICPVYAKKCPVFAPYMQKNAPYMLRICKKMPRICSVYAKKCLVYAPYMEKVPRICTYMQKNAPYMEKMPRICSIPKRWGQRTSKFPHVCFEAVTTAKYYMLSLQAFQKDACEIKIAHLLFTQPQPKTFRLRLPQKLPHISIEAVTTAIYVVLCCHEKCSKVCF